MRFVTSIFLATSVCVFFGHSRAAISLNDTLSTTSRTLSTYRQLLNRTSASLNRNPAFANTSITNSSTEDFVQPKKVTQVYNVWPKNGSVQDRNLDILGIFLDFGLSFSQINCSQFGSDLNRVNFFTAPMTDDQASVLNKNNEVSSSGSIFSRANIPTLVS